MVVSPVGTSEALEYTARPQYAPPQPGSLMVRQAILRDLVTNEARPIPPPDVTASTP